ncbi:Uncharacterised protein [Helicobacter muridarum]|uniref:Uncharacterized protein n=1 Tax=Helicobacter muridarum TaxID=216 RepID=A0A377PVE9_9HELI|nr:Uncharacterised protein [Helicobacter muridarum]
MKVTHIQRVAVEIEVIVAREFAQDIMIQMILAYKHGRIT